MNFPRNCLFEPGDTPPRKLRTPRLREQGTTIDPSAQSGTATAFSGELLGRDRTRDNATTDKRSCCRAIFPARSSIKLLLESTL